MDRKKRMENEARGKLDEARQRARQFRVKSRQGMRTTTVTLSEEDHDALRHLAIDQHLSMTEVVRQIVRDYIEVHRRGGKR